MAILAKEVKQRLKQLRVSKSLTEAELTSLLIEKGIDLKYGDINRFEREWDKLPNHEIILGYCEIFKVDDDYIIFGREKKDCLRKLGLL